jgi:hypothetical protein
MLRDPRRLVLLAVYRGSTEVTTHFTVLGPRELNPCGLNSMNPDHDYGLAER